MHETVRLTGWRRIANAMWRAPDDPQIFGALELDAQPILASIEVARARGVRLTPTHLVGHALARALQAVPDLNVKIRGGRARPRETVDIFFITAVDKGRDLSGVKIADAARKSVFEVATELRVRSTAMKQGRDREFTRTKRALDALPLWLLESALRATAFLTQDLGLDLPVLGLRREPFGSAMVTSVGMFGLPHGYAPLAWMYDVPVLILVGEIGLRPAVVGDRVEPRPMLPITATIDHRYVDGWHVSRAMNAFREYLTAPERFEAPRQPTEAHAVIR